MGGHREVKVWLKNDMPHISVHTASIHVSCFRLLTMTTIVFAVRPIRILLTALVNSPDAVRNTFIDLACARIESPKWTGTRTGDGVTSNAMRRSIEQNDMMCLIRSELIISRVQYIYVCRIMCT